MTLCKNTQEIKTENGILTICQEWEKFAAVGFWCVYYTRNGAQYSEKIRTGLRNKPTKRQIQNYIDSVEF